MWTGEPLRACVQHDTLNFCQENMSNEEYKQVLKELYDAHIQHTATEKIVVAIVRKA